MWQVIDLIASERIEGLTKDRALKIAAKRVGIHNSEFAYRHRGKHYNQNAVYKLDSESKTITIERG